MGFAAGSLLLLPLGAYGEEVENTSGPQCKLSKDLEDLTQWNTFRRSKSGLVVRDLDTGTTLFAHQPDTALVPASNVKLVSSAAALHVLGPDFRFITSLHGELEADGSLERDLYIKSDGDPWMVPERVWSLANRLKYLGVKRIPGDIIVDESAFGGTQWPHGWEQDRSSYAYMAPSGAASVGFNAVLVHVYPALKSGVPAEVKIEPEQGYLRIDNTAVTTDKGRTNLTVSVVPEEDRSVVKIEGRINIKDQPRRHWRRIDNPAMWSGEVFKATLEQVGVEIEGEVRVGLLPEGTPQLLTYASPRLADLLEKVNKYSNNFMAQQIALALGADMFEAPATWQKAEAAIHEFLETELDFEPGSFSIRNASGLHDVNRMSATQFVKLLDYMYHDERYSTEYLVSLASSGGAGTLSNRMNDDEAQGMVRAKTGTLSIASALSGYATSAHGHTLGFSFLVNDYQQPLRDVWALQNAVGKLLVEYKGGCDASDAPVSIEQARILSQKPKSRRNRFRTR